MLKTDRNGVDYTVKYRQVQQSIPVPVRWRDGSHIASRLLTPSENERVFQMLGRKQKVLACTVAQVWFALPINTSVWQKKYVGVICFVKDSALQSYFIRLFDISIGSIGKERAVLWEQEIYRQFRYKDVFDTFHTLEGDFCNVGLNFCDAEEAQHFRHCINERISFFKKIRQRARERKEIRFATSTVQGLKQARKLRKNQNSVLKRELADPESSKECAKSKGIPNSQRAKGKPENEDEIAFITFSSEDDSYRNTGLHSAKADAENSPVAVPAVLREDESKAASYDHAEDISVEDKQQLSQKHSLIPILKNSAHSLPRKRSRGTLRNLHFQSQLKVKKLHEQQQEYHSTMIRTCFQNKATTADNSDMQGCLLVDTSSHGYNGNSRSLIGPKTSASRCMSRRLSENYPDSDFSFPSLPSVEKLQLSPSMQRYGIGENVPITEQHSKRGISTSNSQIWGMSNEKEHELGYPDNVSKVSETILQVRQSSTFSSTTVVKVLDMRSELMKSIVAGKKLRKVALDDVMLHRKSESLPENKVVTSLLAKALEERNKALKDSSDEDDEAMSDEWEEASENGGDSPTRIPLQSHSE